MRICNVTTGRIAAVLVLLALPSPAQQDGANAGAGLVLASRDSASPLGSEQTVSVASAQTRAGRLEARAAIDKANQQWMAAFRSGNFPSMEPLYTKDASLTAPGASLVEGPTGIVGYFRSRRDRGLGDPSLRTVDVVTMGDVAYETGTYGFTSSPSADEEGGLVATETGKYFVIWKAAEDGTWRYNVGIWTGNPSSLSAR